jgi:hypothetical protein
VQINTIWTLPMTHTINPLTSSYSAGSRPVRTDDRITLRDLRWSSVGAQDPPFAAVADFSG